MFFYLIQTTLFSSWSLKPDLFLILLVFLTAGRGYQKGLLWGSGLGLFLDIYSAPFYYHIFIYALLGLVLGFIPAGYFRSYRSLALASIVFATLFSNLLLAATSGFFFKNYTVISLPGLIFLLFLNGLLIYLFADLLAKYFGVNVQAE